MKKHLWYVDVIVETAVQITVIATDEQDAFARVNDGNWHNCTPPTCDNAKVKAVGTFTKGSEVN